VCLATGMAGAQSRTGELRLKVTDQQGKGISAKINVLSAANGYETHQTSDADGLLDLTALPYGLYRIEVAEKGFATDALIARIDSNIPEDRYVHLKIPVVSTVVEVSGDETLIDPERTSSVQQIGSVQIDRRVGSLPGRSVQDLVNSQPG